jgi:hypothetical protein
MPQRLEPVTSPAPVAAGACAGGLRAAASTKGLAPVARLARRRTRRDVETCGWLL